MPALTLILPSSFFTRILDCQHLLEQPWRRLAWDQTTTPPSPGACRKYPPSARWLQIYSASTNFIRDTFRRYPSVFYHPGRENLTADNASCLFNFPDTPFFISHMPSTYPQMKTSCKIYPPLPQLLSCMIYTLRRKLCNQNLLK